MIKNVLFGVVCVLLVVMLYIDMKQYEVNTDRVVMYTTAYKECLKQYNCSNVMCKQVFEQLEKSVNKLKLNNE